MWRRWHFQSKRPETLSQVATKTNGEGSRRLFDWQTRHSSGLLPCEGVRVSWSVFQRDWHHQLSVGDVWKRGMEHDMWASVGEMKSLTHWSVKGKSKGKAKAKGKDLTCYVCRGIGHPARLCLSERWVNDLEQDTPKEKTPTKKAVGPRRTTRHSNCDILAANLFWWASHQDCVMHSVRLDGPWWPANPETASKALATWVLWQAWHGSRITVGRRQRHDLGASCWRRNQEGCKDNTSQEHFRTANLYQEFAYRSENE